MPVSMHRSSVPSVIGSRASGENSGWLVASGGPEPGLQRSGLADGVVRHPDRPHLARRHELVEHARHLLGMGQQVGPVYLVEVDGLAAQPPQ